MKHIAVLSGGLDSTVTLARMKSEADPGDVLAAITFNYGQRHLCELRAAGRIAPELGVPLQIVDVRHLIGGRSSLLYHGDVPDGHYADESMKSTVVHARNMLFASIAVSMAGEGGAVWLGVHGGDHHIYPDCRPSFWEPFSEAVRAAYGVEMVLPYLYADKTEIVREGTALGAPLADTWSCYKGGERHCGTCGTCTERREAFALAGIADPTSYKEYR